MKVVDRKNIQYYLFLFFLSSIAGWFGEIIYRFIQCQKIVNPGTLFGFWCPIYGVATVLISFLVKKEDSIILNFFKIIVIATIVEYVSAFISEEFFNHRLWDYSAYALNFEGRICLQMSFLFAIVGMISVYVFLPKLTKLYQKNKTKIIKVNQVLLVLFLLNILIECFV